MELGHDIRSRLTRITSDRLKIELQYDRRGNIQTQRWQNGQFDSDPVLWNYYRYHYDRDYRLVAADYSQVRYTCGPSTERLGGLGEEPFVKKGTQVYAAAKDQAADPPYTGKEQYARHPQVDDLDYAADPELLQALVEAMGAGAFEGFTPAYRYGGVDFLESVVQADSTWRTAQQLDLSQGTGQPCPAVIEPSDRYDCWYRYDRIGNITRLKRKQLAPTGSFAMNWMDYSYPAGLVSSRLSKVGDVNSPISPRVP